MAGLAEELVDNASLFHQVVLNEHSTFFLLLPLFCGFITLLLYLLLPSFSWNSNTLFGDRRKACQWKPKLPYPPETDEQGRIIEELPKHAIRKLSKRACGVGDDPEASQQKPRICQKENINVQKEQLDVCAMEKKITESYRAELEKIENFQIEQGEPVEKMSELQERLDKVVLDYEFEKHLREMYEKDLECSFTENNTYKKVIERFWSVREQVTGPCDAENNEKRASILLQESEELWSYGETNKILSDQAAEAKANLAMAQEELKVYAALLEKLQVQIEEENCARRKVEDSLSHFKKQLSHSFEFIESELKQLNADKTALKRDIAQLSNESKGSIIALLEACNGLVSNAETPNMENELNIIACETAAQANEVVAIKETKESNDVEFTTENDGALAQALHEKVAALFLLSQQEGKHLESTQALQSEISSLKNELMQVTNEKVKALLELAWLQGEYLKLQETSKLRPEKSWRHSNGQWSPVSDHGLFFEDDDSLTSFTSDSPREPHSQHHPKNSWAKGSPESVNRTKSLTSVLSLGRSKDTDVGGIQRLRAENASLRDSLRGIRHLCQSANRLRLTIARIAADTGVQTESAIQLAVEAVDGVISEALHLKVALHSSLPVDDLGWNSIGSPLLGPSEFGDRDLFDEQMSDDLDIVSFFGAEIVRLVLLAAQLQKRFLGQNV